MDRSQEARQKQNKPESGERVKSARGSQERSGNDGDQSQKFNHVDGKEVRNVDRAKVRNMDRAKVRNMDRINQAEVEQAEIA